MDELEQMLNQQGGQAHLINNGPDLKECEIYKCDKCEGITFTPVMVLRRVPGVMLGLGANNQIVPEQALQCTKCGELHKKDRIYFGLEKEEQKNETDLII